MNNLPAMRADFVGSFLRPEAVKNARLQLAAGAISPEELKAVEDAAIRDLVTKFRLVQEVAKEIWG